MTEDIDLSEIDKKYKDKCSLIKAGTCKNVNIFLQQSRENARLKEKIKMYKSEDTIKHNIIMETLQHEKKALDVSIKYKQTLQEIKEIAKTGMHCEGMGCDFMPKILNLITKAEEVR